MKVVQLEHFTLEIHTYIGMYFKYMYFYILLCIEHRGFRLTDCSLCDRLIIESLLILFTVVLRIEIKFIGNYFQ